MNWLQKIISSNTKIDTKIRKEIPEGLWLKCENCNGTIYKTELIRNLYVCPRCNFHMRISARERLKIFLDENNPQEEIGQNIVSQDKLNFKDTKKYIDRISNLKKTYQEDSSLVVVKGALFNMPLVVGVFDFNYIGGSLGVAEGERFVAAAKRALHEKIPFVCFTASGGARMQEGLFSLMQMARTSTVLSTLDFNRIPYITVLTNPTTGGVSASLASLGDIIIAEPGAIIGFAGKRVIEQTVHQQLPFNFQKSEFLLEHGAIDMIVERKDLRQKIYRLLTKLSNK